MIRIVFDPQITPVAKIIGVVSANPRYRASRECPRNVNFWGNILSLATMSFR